MREIKDPNDFESKKSRSDNILVITEVVIIIIPRANTVAIAKVAFVFFLSKKYKINSRNKVVLHVLSPLSSSFSATKCPRENQIIPNAPKMPWKLERVSIRLT